MPVPDGCDSDKTLRQLLADNAYNILVGNARNLTLGDTWRMAGWALPGQPPIADDPVLGQLSPVEMRSIAQAIEVHLRNKGNGKGWKYISPTYACGPCCASAVVLLPHRRD